MAADPVYVQLMWEDPQTGDVKRPRLSPPIALGRETEQMPVTLGERTVAHLELAHSEVSRFHALITVANDQLYLTDRSANGTFLNGHQLHKSSRPFSSRDTLRIGPYKITASLTSNSRKVTTDLVTRDQNAVSPTTQIRQRNTLLIWLIGMGVLVLTGFGSWAFISFLLEQARPDSSHLRRPVKGEEIQARLNSRTISAEFMVFID